MPDVTTMSPVLQYGAFGLCFVLIVVLYLTMTRVLNVLQQNTKALTRLTTVLTNVEATSADVRDRLLQWQCPFRHDPDRPADPSQWDFGYSRDSP